MNSFVFLFYDKTVTKEIKMHLCPKNGSCAADIIKYDPSHIVVVQAMERKRGADSWSMTI
ncbi:hypothetical protein STFR1_40268 [Bacillus vallismortis]